MGNYWRVFLIGVWFSLLPLASAAEPEPPVFRLQLADGTTGTGPLAEWGPDWTVRLGGPSPRRANGSEIVSLRRADQPLPAPPLQEHVILANGDRLPGTVLKLQGEQLTLRANWGEPRDMRIPLSTVSLIWLTAPDKAEHPGQMLRQLASSKRKRDTVLLRNGDVLEGVLSALDRDGRLRIEVARKEVAVDFAKVAAVGLNTDLLRPPRHPGLSGRLILANGCRVTLTSAKAMGGRLTGATLFGAEVSLSLDDVLAVDLISGCAVYLSDSKPRHYEFTPYLGTVHWPYMTDGSVAGRDIRLGGSTYDKGLGMHSASRLTYDLGGKYHWFEAIVGLDDVSGRLGSARIRILVDGKAQGGLDSLELTAATGPRPVHVNVAGARELTLIVDFGAHADVQDHVDWADAQLIK